MESRRGKASKCVEAGLCPSPELGNPRSMYAGHFILCVRAGNMSRRRSGAASIPGKREAEDRWEAIAAAIREYEVGSVLDVGCAEGWFLRRAAKDFGCFSLGVEALDRRLIDGRTGPPS